MSVAKGGGEIVSGACTIGTECFIVTPEQYQCEEGGDVLVLKASGCAVPEFVANDQAQIRHGVLNQDALENIVSMSEVNPSHAAGFQRVREWPFQHQASLSE